jgi:hypothetical protein
MCSANVMYVLKCQHGKFYVGRCVPRHLHARLMAHRMGRGSKWTQLHPAICIERARESWDPLDEDVEVLALMRRHGIEQVRGGSFVFPVLDSATLWVSCASSCFRVLPPLWAKRTLCYGVRVMGPSVVSSTVVSCMETGHYINRGVVTSSMLSGGCYAHSNDKLAILHFGFHLMLRHLEAGH